MRGLQEPVVTRGNFLIDARLLQQVTRQLFARELVEWEIVVEGVNHVVAIR